MGGLSEKGRAELLADSSAGSDWIWGFFLLEDEDYLDAIYKLKGTVIVSLAADNCYGKQI